MIKVLSVRRLNEDVEIKTHLWNPSDLYLEGRNVNKQWIVDNMQLIYGLEGECSEKHQ